MRAAHKLVGNLSPPSVLSGGGHLGPKILSWENKGRLPAESECWVRNLAINGVRGQ